MSATWVNTIVGIVGIIVGIVGTLATIWAISKKKTITIVKKTSVYCSHLKKGTFKLFRTKWSKASNTSIHAYKDGVGIVAIALVKKIDDIEKMRMVESDFSSRCRTPRIGDGIIWQNASGNYAITKVISIKDDTRGDDHDELTCDYVIIDS